VTRESGRGRSHHIGVSDLFKHRECFQWGSGFHPPQRFVCICGL